MHTATCTQQYFDIKEAESFCLTLLTVNKHTHVPRQLTEEANQAQTATAVRTSPPLPLIKIGSFHDSGVVSCLALSLLELALSLSLVILAAKLQEEPT